MASRGRPSFARSVGLEPSYEQASDGTWTCVATDDRGKETYRSPGHVSRKAAGDGLKRWVRENFEQAHVPAGKPRPTPGLRDLTDAGNNAQLVRVLRRKAEANDQAAARYRQQADLLEVEAKRLAAAADVLEGPEHA
jgi:hypothetical protein